jgi:hypothetical protein
MVMVLSWMPSLSKSRGAIERVSVAERDRGGDERVDVAGFGSMVDDRGADREPVTDPRGRRRDDAGLLEIDDDPGIQRVRVVAAIAEADDIERNGG